MKTLKLLCCLGFLVLGAIACTAPTIEADLPPLPASPTGEPAVPIDNTATLPATAPPTSTRPAPSLTPTAAASQTPTRPVATSTAANTAPPSLPTYYPITGIQIYEAQDAAWVKAAAQAGGAWTREDTFNWDKIEPAKADPPIYDWSSVNEAAIQNSSANGQRVIGLIQFAPTWAQKIPGTACGPIADTERERFARFMEAAVARYSQPPFNIQYWEIGNEPEASASLVGPHSAFGCWGNPEDEYYGGEDYAAMLKVVTPRIKAVDPNAQVLIGGLLLDCDPLNPPETKAGSGVYKDCSPSKFLEGILKGGGGEFFDAVNFHSYDYFSGAGIEGRYSNFNWHAVWNTTGPAFVPKYRYLADLLAQYGLADKYVVNTENALLCGKDGTEAVCQSEAYANTKAAYIAHSNTMAAVLGIRLTLWYSLQGWRASGLVRGAATPLPAFEAYRFSATMLRDAYFQKEITNYPSIKVYEFVRTDGKRFWVMWAQSESPEISQSIASFPSQPKGLYNVFGAALPIQTPFSLTWSPIYVEW